AVVDWETTQMLIDHPQFKRLWQTPIGYMFPLDMRPLLELGRRKENSLRDQFSALSSNSAIETFL
ncbi:MAG: hypothetical protein WCJ72_10795, partial [Chryseobacterium sp.]